MAKKLRIAIHDSNRNEMPPHGVIQATAWIAYEVAEAMAKRGHDVTLFAAKGTKTKVRLVTGGAEPAVRTPIAKYLRREPQSVMYRERERAWTLYESLTISEIYKRHKAKRFDVLHFNRVHYAIPFSRVSDAPHLFTIHDPASPLHTFLLKKYSKSNTHFVSISRRQRELSPELRWFRTIHNGTDINHFKYSDSPDDHVMFAGRIASEKGPHRAIIAANKAGVPIRVYGTPAFQTAQQTDFWEEEIAPRINRGVSYEGLVSRRRLAAEYAKARAVLMPITWEEPFGLVAIEAMACGTP
ncbi:MAG: glycosyltransferase [Patescibacteria group bacterium]|nr:glycosyltransferase [Patescibacteria group bacterium]